MEELQNELDEQKIILRSHINRYVRRCLIKLSIGIFVLAIFFTGTDLVSLIAFGLGISITLIKGDMCSLFTIIRCFLEHRRRMKFLDDMVDYTDPNMAEGCTVEDLSDRQRVLYEIDIFNIVEIDVFYYVPFNCNEKLFLLMYTPREADRLQSILMIIRTYFKCDILDRRRIITDNTKIVDDLLKNVELIEE